MENKIEKIEKKLIGIINGETCSSEETQKQIDNILQYEINISENDKPVLWSDVYDKTNKEDRVLFNCIIADRKMRVDKKIPMADRPLFAVCTIIDDVCVRIEYYEGHDCLEKTFDLRSKELKNQDLEDYYKEDENAYNPIEFLKQKKVIDKDKEKLFSNILDILHSSSEEELKKKAEEYFKEKN